MSGRDRMALFPSRANFVFIKQRIASAQKGLNLLKRKRDALGIHLKQLIAELKAEHVKLEVVMQEAHFSISKANFLRADLKPVSLLNQNRAEAYVIIKTTKIVGVNVPTLELILNQSKNAFSLTGLAGGGQQVQTVREKFQNALKVLVALASLQYSLASISEAVKQNNMRVNGLEYRVLPRYQNTMEYIREELDEFEREDFYRLKRSQAKQLKKKMEFIKLMRHREKEKDARDPGYDFIDTHMQTPVEKILVAKSKNIMHERRKTVSKVDGKIIVIETDEPKPIDLGMPLVRWFKRKAVELPTKKVVTSSSEDESSSD